MNDFYTAIRTAVDLITGFDSDLIEIVVLSLKISTSAVFIATLIGLPLAALIALRPFPGRSFVIAVLNSFMGLPPVVVGLLVYLLLSRAGPFGSYGLLFTPDAMIIAQTFLVLPIIIALSRQTLTDLLQEYAEQFRSFRLTIFQSAMTLIWEGRFSLVTAVLAGFGRASAEVGAVMIVGGNINHVTRVMTTSIALETNKGNLSLALGLGFILISLTFLVNLLAYSVQRLEQRS